jgi:uncharacterized protein (UPF0147 family)
MSVQFTASKLAELLGVSQAAVSGAAINNHLCQEYPVADWADKSERGRIRGFNVPDDIFNEIVAKRKQVEKPDKEEFGLLGLLARYYPEEAKQKEGYVSEEEEIKYVEAMFKNALADESLPKKHRRGIARAFKTLRKAQREAMEKRTAEEKEIDEHFRFIESYLRDNEVTEFNDDE